MKTKTKKKRNSGKKNSTDFVAAIIVSFFSSKSKQENKTQQFCRLTEKKCSNFFLYLKTSCLERKNSFFQSFFFVDSHHTTHTHTNQIREKEKKIDIYNK